MKNMNLFLVSISALLMVAMIHASVDDQSVESRVLQQLRVRQQELPSEIAQAVELMAQGMNLNKEELEQLKDPVVINFAHASIKLYVAEKKAELVSANEQIRLLTTKEPVAKYAQLKELLEKRGKFAKIFNGTEEDMQKLRSNFENPLEELETVKGQIMQLTTPAGTVPALQAAEKEELAARIEAASEGFFSKLLDSMLTQADEKNQQPQEN